MNGSYSRGRGKGRGMQVGVEVEVDGRGREVDAATAALQENAGFWAELRRSTARQDGCACCAVVSVVCLCAYNTKIVIMAPLAVILIDPEVHRTRTRVPGHSKKKKRTALEHKQTIQVVWKLFLYNFFKGQKSRYHLGVCRVFVKFSLANSLTDVAVWYLIRVPTADYIYVCVDM